MEPDKTNSTELKKAAGLMGKKGGRAVTPKKLAAVRQNIKKAIGKKRGKTYPFRKEAPQLEEMKEPPDSGTLAKMASVMGRKGGAVKSKAKAEAARINAVGGPNGTGRKAGRKVIYHYAKGATAILGVRVRRPCVIPDEVVDDIETFTAQKKNFPVYYVDRTGKKKKGNVSIFSKEGNDLILIQSFTTPRKK